MQHASSHSFNLSHIFACLSTIAIIGIALGLGTQLLAYKMVLQGFSPSLIGYNGTIAGLATIFAAASSGFFAKKWGIKNTILIMLLIGAVNFMGFYFFQTIGIWFLLRFILHFVMTIMFVLSEFWVNQAAPSHKRGFFLALYTITLSLGFAGGAAILTIIGWHGFSPFLAGTLCIISGLVPIILVKDNLPPFQEMQPSSLYSYIFAIPSSTMAALLYGAVQMGALSLLTNFTINLGYGPHEAALFMTAIGLGNAILVIPIGLINDKIKEKRFLLFAIALMGLIATAIIPLIAHNEWLFIGALFLIGGIVAGLYTLGLAQLGHNFKGQELVCANGAFAFCYGAGMLIGPAFIGKASALYFPYGFSLSITAIFGFYSLLLAVKLMKRGLSS